QALEDLKKIGYQVGTCVMIGLPHQTLEDLVQDLLFFKQIDVDMVGMGPYLEHPHTPMGNWPSIPVAQRFQLTMRMIATLRLMMKKVNIAATTALQAIDPVGREKAIKVGANILMPNITPLPYRAYYQLYQGKPCLDEDGEQCLGCLDTRMKSINESIDWSHWGDSLHFATRR
ncbi:MAG: [FeFe] hydrogenase H-cluster radical SAM maturase HydE, partial [Pseudomonadota bacterium]